MPFFLESCRQNSTIHWIFYTDCSFLENCPENVSIKSIDFSAYCALVSTRLGIDFRPSNAYKLCDIKPALGFVHEMELVHYDFWAFGDIDLVYGDLRKYFTENRLEKKDLYTTHARRIAGHLTLIRNCSEMNVAFKRVKGWQLLLSSSRHVAFDEKAFSKIFLRHKNSKILRKISEYFDSWLARGEFIEAFSTPNAKVKWVDKTSNFPITWFWNGGKLTNDIDGEKEFAYFHFMVWKQSWLKLNLAGFENLSKNPRIQSFSMSEEQLNYKLITNDA